MNVDLDPAQLRFAGGPFTITATATDDAAVRRVWAVVIQPDGSSTEFDLTGNGDRYAGSWSAPASTAPGAPPPPYRFVVRAEDDAGQVTAAAPVVATVAPAPAPPGTPGL